MTERKSNFFREMLCAFTLLSFLISFSAQAQNCNCNHVIELNTTHIDGSQLGVKPGDVICLKAGRRTNLFIKNIKGSASSPVTIKNCGGQVILGGTDVNNGIMVQNSRYFRITGTGDSGHKYGIKIDKTKSGSQGIAIAEFSSDVEIDHIEIGGAGFAGIMAKTDPKCDGSADRGKFTMYNVKIHDNYMYNIGGEGIYLGNSFYGGTTVYCNRTSYPHEIKNVRVYNNIIKNTGWEGIQVGSATEDVEIYDNEIYNYGQANKDSQNNGIQLGLGTTGKLYRNYIENGYGTGIVIQGIGNNLVYNNVIVGAGYPAFNVNVRPTPLSSDVVSKGFLGGVYIINNTVVDTKNKGAINEHVNEAPNNVFYNNLIVSGSSSWNQLKTYTNWKLDKNLVVKSASEAKFVNASSKDYRLQQGSPAIDAGRDIASYGIKFDWEKNNRKAGATTDAGIHEFAGASAPAPAEETNKAPTVDAGSDKTITLPTKSTSFTAQASDPDGKITSYAWTKTSGPSATMNGTSTAKLELSNLVEGNYVFKLTVKDDKGAAASDEVKLTVSKAASASSSGAPAAPSSLAASSASSSSIKVNWKDNASNEEGFVLERSTSSNFSGSVARITIAANTTSYTDNNKQSGVTFYYRIKAVSGSQSSAFSNVVSAAAGSTASTPEKDSPSTDLSAPGSLQASGASTSSIRLNWQDNAGGEDGYILERSPSSSFSGSGASIKLPANATTYLDNYKQKGVTYYYRVKAVQGSKSSAYSNVVSATTSGSGTTTQNQAPTVNAGSDKTLSLPTNSLTLNGSASDPDGSISVYKWSKVNGPSATLSGESTANLKLSKLVEGSYTFRLTVTDNKNAQAYDEVKVTVNKAASSSTTSPATNANPIYRINAGGNSNLSASPIQWDMDNQANPSRYLSSSSSNNTAGSNSWNGTNKTAAPNAIFGPIRFDFSWGGAMQYKLPVKNGSYEVRLYFAETPYSGGVSGAGQRVFDIKVEGQTKVSGLDIYKEAGMNALQKTVVVNVTDGSLDINFVRKVGNPQINGIEVLPSTNAARTATSSLGAEVEPDSELSVYPNPVDNKINLRFGKTLQSNTKVQLMGLNGETLLQQTLSQTEGMQQTQIDISQLQLSPGMYLLRIQSQGEKEQVVKVLKQ